MDFHDGLSADLPAPRDDEPDGLRDDIVDELADHLACAYRRELMRGVDPATARRRVLERFGDPAAVARRLWLDAMRGKIMSQRILVVCCVLLTLVSLAMAFLMWMQTVHSQRLARRAEAVAAPQMRRAEDVQKQMLEQLAAISKADRSPQSPDWIPVTFKLTQETATGRRPSGSRPAWAGAQGPTRKRRSGVSRTRRAWSISASSSPAIGSSP